MSIDINWDDITPEEHERYSEAIKTFLDEQFRAMPLPSYLKYVSVDKFDIGTIPPEVTIRHVGDPFPDFYNDEDAEEHQEEDESSEKSPGFDNELDSELESSNSSGKPGKPIDLNDPHEYKEIDNEESDGPETKTENFSNRRNQDIYSSGSSVGLHGLSTNGMGYFSQSLKNKDHYMGLGLENLGRHSPLFSGLNLAHLSGEGAATSTGPKGDNVNGAPRQEEQHPSDDTQFIVEIKYKGDMQLDVTASLLLNYPSPSFLSLPIKLRVTGVEVHAIAVVAYLKSKEVVVEEDGTKREEERRRVDFSFLCDIDDDGNAVAHSGKERVQIIKNIQIESEIGDQQQHEGHGSLLRNVGKVESFLLNIIRSVCRNEVGWPGWIELEY